MRACTSRSPCSLLVLVLVIAGFAVHRPSSLRFVMGGCDGVADFVVSILHRDSSHESVVTVCCLMSVEPRRVCGPVGCDSARSARVRSTGRVGCGCLSSAPRAGAGLPRGRRPANVSERSPRRPRVARRARSSLVVTSYINNSRRIYEHPRRT